MIIFSVTVLWMCAQLTSGLTLLGCNANGKNDIFETTPLTLNCMQTVDKVFWQVATSYVSVCNATSCTVYPGFSHLLVSRPNASSSSLHLFMTDYRGSTVRVQCRSPELEIRGCYLRCVYTEKPTSCQFNVTRSPPTITGSCRIDKIYSGDGSYICFWTEVFQNQSNKIIQGQFTNMETYTDTATGRTYRRGVCSFSFNLFPVNGRYQYFIDTDPGFPVHVATLTVDGADITLSAPSFVTTSLDGSPGSIEEASTTSTTTITPTTSIITSSTTTTSTTITGSSAETSTSAPKIPTTTLGTGQTSPDRGDGGGGGSNTAAYLGAGVGGGLGLILIIVIVVFGVLHLRKRSDAKPKEAAESPGTVNPSTISSGYTGLGASSHNEPEHIYHDLEPMGMQEYKHKKDPAASDDYHEYMTPIPDHEYITPIPDPDYLTPIPPDDTA